MIVPAQAVRVVIATRPIDFRKGHDDLAAQPQNELGLDPHSGAVVVFRSKRGDRSKVLMWDGTGMVLVYKRLEGGTFACPRSVCHASSDDALIEREEADGPLDGYRVAIRIAEFLGAELNDLAVARLNPVRVRRALAGALPDRIHPPNAQ